MKTKTYRHNADNTTYYKKITVNYFLHTIVTFIYIVRIALIAYLSMITLPEAIIATQSEPALLKCSLGLYIYGGKEYREDILTDKICIYLPYVHDRRSPPHTPQLRRL